MDYVDDQSEMSKCVDVSRRFHRRCQMDLYDIRVRKYNEDICRKARVPGGWFRNGIADLFPLFAFTFKGYSFVGFMLVIEVTVIQFAEMGAC